MMVRQNLIIAGVVVAAVWLVFLFQLIWPGLIQYGIQPRQLVGLTGLVASPFLHGGWRHIMANTLPLFILLFLALSFSRNLTVEALVIILLGGGGLVWLTGRSHTVHVGASGVIFGLLGFLIFGGLFRRDLKALGLALLVLFLYGGVIISGFIPAFGVSWSSHFFGFVAGLGAAWLARREKAE
ncbi:MAG: rhomboid family intramembrane serine protease [Thermodesulfobacteriota bacterium]